MREDEDKKKASEDMNIDKVIGYLDAATQNRDNEILKKN